METLWFALLSLMLTGYVVLDGFDLGAGVLHLLVAKTDMERRQVFASIGPLWDGNEVWLIAGGGTMFFAFPRVYAASFSGFYLALMMVLWLLILRGVSIELRHQLEHPLWKSFWDASFALGSSLLAFLLGVAFGNVLRGVPLDEHGTFKGTLFTNFLLGPHPGAVDWFTALTGAFSVSILAMHGALFLRWKTEGALATRSLRAARLLGIVSAILFALVTLAVFHARPDFFSTWTARPVAWLFSLMVGAGVVSLVRALRGPSERAAFLSSCAIFVGLLGATAAVVFPVLLPSTLSSGYTLTAFNSANDAHTLTIGLIGWVPAFALALGYFTYLFRSFQGKVSVHSMHEG